MFEDQEWLNKLYSYIYPPSIAKEKLAKVIAFYSPEEIEEIKKVFK